MDIDADVALLGHERLAGVDSHSHADRAGPEGALAGLRGGEGVLRARERDEEGVSLRVDLDAAVTLEGLPQHAAVLGEDVRVSIAQLLQQAWRALDVGEEEGDGAARELAHARMIRQKALGA